MDEPSPPLSSKKPSRCANCSNNNNNNNTTRRPSLASSTGGESSPDSGLGCNVGGADETGLGLLDWDEHDSGE